MEEELKFYLRKHATELPTNSDNWDEYDQQFVYAIRGKFRRFIKELHIDPYVEDLIMEALTEDATKI